MAGAIFPIHNGRLENDLDMNGYIFVGSSAPVPSTRTVNGYPLSADVQLDNFDVAAVPLPDPLSLTPATKTKITYNVYGLVTAGADATTADIADSTNRRYVTDAQRSVIIATSGTNTGDQDLSGYSLTTHTHTFASLTSKPTTISGYGITDAFTQAAADALYSVLGHVHTFASLTSKPTTIAGYGVTDAYTKTEVDNAVSSAVVGLLDDRGNYNASGNVFPSSGGSGSAGAILKGDVWTISVAGTLNGIAVTAGDVLRALTDSPGQTGSNWVVTENNLGYVPVNAAGTLALAGFSSITGTLPVANGGTGITSFGTGVATALGINVGSAGAFITFNGAGGTPSSLTLTNATGLPIAGIASLGTNIATFLGATKPTTIAGYGITDFNSLGDARWQPLDSDLTSWATVTRASGFDTFVATPSSANLAALLTDETGSGANVFGTSPTIVTPTISSISSAVGVTLNLAATISAATTAGIAGTAVTITASNAVAGTVTAGAVAGGGVTITAGNAARLTSGNANGGDITLVTGSGIGTGVMGSVLFPDGTTTKPGFAFAASTGTGFYRGGSDQFWFLAGSANVFRYLSQTLDLSSVTKLAWSSDTSYSSRDLSLQRVSAGVLEIDTGTTGNWSALKLGNYDTATNTVTDGLTIAHKSSSGTPAAGYGEGILFNLNSSTTADQNAMRLRTEWTTATHASRTSKYVLSLVNNAGALSDVWTIAGDGTVTATGVINAPAASLSSATTQPLILNTTGGVNNNLRWDLGSVTKWYTGVGSSDDRYRFLNSDANGTAEIFSLYQDKSSAFGGPTKLKNYTVATLPTGVEGQIAYVTDALAPAFLSTVVGGGTVKTQVFYNGTNWVAQ
jgi:hypothetical protein